MKLFLTLFLLLSFASRLAIAQNTSAANPQPRTEVAAEYTYLRSNAPPAGCGCFSLNGGSISVAQPVATGKFAFAFDASFARGKSPDNFDLMLSALTAGLRYRPMPAARWNPFGQALFGLAHASGSLVSGSAPAASDPPLLIAGNIGGGVDLKLNRRWSLRLVEANYLFTTFSNGVNDHQNNLRVSTGLVYRFGKK